MKHISFIFLLSAVCGLLSLTIGCGSNVPLTGTVTFADDGNPLTAGIICFVDGHFLARGHLQSDGTYKISSTGRNDGLPKGMYKVYFVGAELITSEAGGNSIYTPLIHHRYSNPDTSGIEFEVDGKTRRFDFTVERAP